MFIQSIPIITLLVQPTMSQYHHRQRRIVQELRVLFIYFGRASSIQQISSKLFQPLCVKFGYSSIVSCDGFHIFAITLILLFSNVRMMLNWKAEDALHR